MLSDEAAAAHRANGAIAIAAIGYDRIETW
jgi:hypothetical protein